MQCKWIILYAVLLHMAWGIALLVDVSAANITALNGISKILGTSGLGILSLLVAVSAAVSTLLTDRPLGLVLVLPQQMLLVLSASSALEAIISGHFPDGVFRPAAFIFCDQLPAILIVILHTGAILELHARELWKFGVASLLSWFQ